MDSLCLSDEQHTKFHVNRTIFNEVNLILYKTIDHEISFIMVQIRVNCTMIGTLSGNPN